MNSDFKNGLEYLTRSSQPSELSTSIVPSLELRRKQGSEGEGFSPGTLANTQHFPDTNDPCSSGSKSSALPLGPVCPQCPLGTGYKTHSCLVQINPDDCGTLKVVHPLRSFKVLMSSRENLGRGCGPGIPALPLLPNLFCPSMEICPEHLSNSQGLPEARDQCSCFLRLPGAS